jgi:uncharacterized protein YdaU (DUF1376 family)
MTEPKNIPWYIRFDWNRYVGECSLLGLTPEQQGCYMKLICTFWANRGRPLPNEPEIMARVVGVTVDRWTRKIQPALARLFQVSEDGWSHDWIGDEWRETARKIAVKSKNGAEGGRGHSKKSAGSFENLPQEISPEIPKTQTAKSLENNETEKATAYPEVSVSFSNKNQSKEEESKKESPLKPPQGGMDMETQDGSVVPPTADQQLLFHLQEVQQAPEKPQKQKKSRRGKSEPPPVPEEIFQAFWILNPPPDEANKYRHNEKATRHNMAKTVESGVDPQELIQSWSNYRDQKRYTGKFHTEFIMAAQNFVSLTGREWEKYRAPFVPPKHNGNVTPLRNGMPANGQVPSELVQRAGRRIV